MGAVTGTDTWAMRIHLLTACAALAASFALLGAPAAGARQHTPSGGTTTPTATTCVSESLPAKPGGGSWACSFDDEFDSTTGDASALNMSVWTPQVTATSGYTTGPWPNF